MVVQEIAPTSGDSAELRADIEVTAEDIKKAKKALAAKGRFRSRCCPVAQAINRQLLPGMQVSVGGVDARVWVGEESEFSPYFEDDICDFILPTAASAFITAFDAGAEVQPFTFTLDLSEPQ